MKSRVAAMSVLSNSTLVVFKLVVGLFTGAVSILSEATFDKQFKLMATPEQIVALKGLTVKVGVGLTVMVKLLAGPTHPFNVGVTETVAINGPPDRFTGATQLLIFPTPLADKPTVVFELDQA